MKILFLGDVFAKPGRNAVTRLVPKLITTEGLDLVIANAENVANGSGVTPELADELLAAEVRGHALLLGPANVCARLGAHGLQELVWRRRQREAHEHLVVAGGHPLGGDGVRVTELDPRGARPVKQQIENQIRAVLEPLVIALAPFAPHIAEELWEKLGHNTSITTAVWPKWDAQYLVEDNFSYPISFNGKTRMMIDFPIALSKEEVEAQVLANPEVQSRLEGKPPKKVIVVPKRIVNIVV